MKLFEPASTNLLAEAELAQELSHDLHTRYIDKQLKKAEAEVRKEHAAMRKISGAWSGMGALEVFRGWRKWARREAKRRAKDVFCAQRDELKWAADCVAALELAQWTVDKYAISASRGAAAPSRHRRDSCPSDEVVAGFFFEFEAIRTVSSEYDAPRR